MYHRQSSGLCSVVSKRAWGSDFSPYGMWDLRSRLCQAHRASAQSRWLWSLSGREEVYCWYWPACWFSCRPPSLRFSWESALVKRRFPHFTSLPFVAAQFGLQDLRPTAIRLFIAQPGMATLLNFFQPVRKAPNRVRWDFLTALSLRSLHPERWSSS